MTSTSAKGLTSLLRKLPLNLELQVPRPDERIRPSTEHACEPVSILVGVGSPVLDKNRSLAAAVYEDLKARILSGDLKPGERLIEQDVAQGAEVSRTPVREALRRLVADGLVHNAGGRGLEVRAVELGELADICAVRESLEAMAASLAASARSQLDLANLRDILDRERDAVEESSPVDVQARLNAAFHDRIVYAARNRYLETVLGSTRDRISHLQQSTLGNTDRQQSALAEHESILEAIELKDANLASSLTHDHFRKATFERLVMLSRDA